MYGVPVTVLIDREIVIMALAEHIEALTTKHERLDVSLHQEEVRLNPDDTVISDLKRQKLRIKDEIARLSDGS